MPEKKADSSPASLTNGFPVWSYEVKPWWNLKGVVPLDSVRGSRMSATSIPREDLAAQDHVTCIGVREGSTSAWAA